MQHSSNATSMQKNKHRHFVITIAVLSFLLVLAIIASVKFLVWDKLSVTGNIEKNNPQAVDNAVKKLDHLGIITGYEDNSYNSKAIVTRAEMTALIARIQGVGDSAAVQSVTVFADVPASHWASGYIADATAKGIISNSSRFRPEAPICFEEAIQMIMATLGYTPYAKSHGDYPFGYIEAAKKFNVLADVSDMALGKQVDRGTMALLLANAIETPIMKEIRITSGAPITYIICDGKDGREHQTLMDKLADFRTR